MNMWAKLSWWVVTLAGCVSGNVPGTDTSTDWVETCSAPSMCSSAQECICKLCTHDCDNDAECADLSPGAVCAHTLSACGVDATICVPDRDFSWLDTEASEASSGTNLTSTNRPPSSSGSDAGDASKLAPSTTCEGDETCGSDQQCLRGSCVECGGLTVLDSIARAESLNGVAEGCQTDADCVYFRRRSPCGDLACEWQTSTPLAVVHGPDVSERIASDVAELCAASAELGCERPRDCIGDSEELYELACQANACVMAIAPVPNPCSLASYDLEAPMDGERMDCGVVDLSDEEQAQDLRIDAYDCLRQAHTACAPAVLTVVSATEEGASIVTETAITPTADDGVCSLDLFVDSREDAVGQPSLQRKRCVVFEPGDDETPPSATDCELQAECRYWR